MKKGIAGIVLAAGASSRMGQPKMMLPYKQKTIIRHVIEVALRSNLDHLIVVINPQVDGLLQEASVPGVKNIIQNNHFQAGMSTSVKKGILSLPEQTEAAVILLGDQPEINEQAINKVIDTYHAKDKPSIVRAAFWNNEKGHPVLLKHTMFPHLLQIEGDSGGKAVIQTFSGETAYAELDQINIPDVDTFEDYERLVKGKGG
jgi:molybdenum cofactor cytidylyltransferase